MSLLAAPRCVCSEGCVLAMDAAGTGSGCPLGPLSLTCPLSFTGTAALPRLWEEAELQPQPRAGLKVSVLDTCISSWHWPGGGSCLAAVLGSALRKSCCDQVPLQLPAPVPGLACKEAGGRGGWKWKLSQSAGHLQALCVTRCGQDMLAAVWLSKQPSEGSCSEQTELWDPPWTSASL